MRIALTGVPGVGKTKIARALAKKGQKVIILQELVEKHNLIKGYDRSRNCKIVDLKRLASFLRKLKLERDIFLVAHYSHLLENELTIVLRCFPAKLEKKLRMRGYPSSKIQENLEAEALGIITAEALTSQNRVYELDLTNLTSKKAAELILKIINKKSTAKRIDWSREILKWY
jgi:adenylate kinase